MKGYIATVNNNVCKRLIGKVVLYAIFVDTRYTRPWTSYDIKSTLDSIQVAKTWLETRAAESNQPLNIEIDYHKNKRVIPISQDLPLKDLKRSLLTIPVYTGIRRTDNWANRVSKEAGKLYPTDSSSMVKTKVLIKDRESLIAKIRDIHKTDNVALIFLLNNYYMNDISVAMHTASNDNNIEYAIISYKEPSVIAHEILHLFGALDLYIGPWDSKKQVKKRKEWAMKEFPDEIMAFAYRDIDSLNISNFTKYLIGWDNTMDEETRKKILGKNIYPIKY